MRGEEWDHRGGLVILWVLTHKRGDGLAILEEFFLFLEEGVDRFHV